MKTEFVFVVKLECPPATGTGAFDSSEVDGCVDALQERYSAAVVSVPVPANPTSSNWKAYVDNDDELKKIFLDQIFGFDGDKNPDGTVILPPVNTYHVGFWFNNPADAANCGFDVSKPTPFNGEHQAGPLAMISVPVAATNLGPLCLDPEEGTPCNPSH